VAEQRTTPGLPAVMSIGASDSMAGSGIQGDLRTFAAMRTFGCCAVTAVTAQSTRSVNSIHVIDERLVEAQIDAVAGDIDCQATKVGMVGSARNAETIAKAIQRHVLQPLVVDCSFVTKHGGRLADDETVAALTKRRMFGPSLLASAAVVVANRREAARLLGGESCDSLSQGVAAAKQISSKFGCHAAIVTGFRRDDPSQEGQQDMIDVFWNGEEIVELEGDFRPTPHTHGASATLASAIVAGLARELPLGEAVTQAKRVVTEAVRQNIDLGQGVTGPLNQLAWLDVKNSHGST